MRSGFSVASGSGSTPSAETQQPGVLFIGDPVGKDELERLIGLCEAPGLLWCHDEATRAAEPFGMIA